MRYDICTKSIKRESAERAQKWKGGWSSWSVVGKKREEQAGRYNAGPHKPKEGG